MKKTIIVGALGLAGVIASQLVGDAHEFYPTQPGDSWTYESSIRGQFTNQVADSLMSDGSVIFRILSTDSSGAEQEVMVRKEGARLYLGPDPESLTLLADFSQDVGVPSPTQVGTRGATHTIVGRHDDHDVFGMRFEEVVEVRIMSDAGSDLTYYFARGVGLVGMESERPALQVRLVRATVGGRAIGAEQAERQRGPDMK